MSWQHYEADCPGCKPAIIDCKNGKVFPDDSPEMQAAMASFREMTLPEKQGWHCFMCQNARDPKAQLAVQLWQERFQARLKIKLL